MTKNCYKVKVLHCTELVTNCFEWKTNHVSIDFYLNTRKWQFCHFCTTSNGNNWDNIYLLPANEVCKGYVFIGVFLWAGGGKNQEGGPVSRVRGLHPRGSASRGRSASKGKVCPNPPPPLDTTGYGQRAGGTHPTGMHSCTG